MEHKNPTMVNSSSNSEIWDNTKHENISYSLSIVRYPITTDEDFILPFEILPDHSERNMKKKFVFFLRRIRTISDFHKLYYNIIEFGNKCMKKVELDNCTLIVSINTIILAKDLYFSGRLWLYAFLPSKKLFWYIFYFFIQWYKIWKWYLF